MQSMRGHNLFMRRTKIVCTIGPASSSEERLEQLMLAGMNVARLNFSHGSHEEHAVVIERIRRLSTRLGWPVAILQDLQGPKIRVGSLPGGQPLRLVSGSQVIVATRLPATNGEGAPLDEESARLPVIPTTYGLLAQDVKPGDRILLDDGLMELRVLASDGLSARCEVVHGGLLKEHKGMNLPGVTVSAPALSEKDRADLRFGVQHGVDYVALSFVRRPEDVLEARRFLQSLQAEMAAKEGHRQHAGDIPLIVKLEKPEAVARLDEILEVADGLMVARGDLGVEMSLEKVPLIQKRVIARCNELGLPVITATQMLESMVTNPTPTRAEVADVSNALLDGTDAVMLSAETASGSYPVEAVAMMVRIIQETEADDRTAQPPQCRRLSQEHAVSHAARALSEEASVRAIVVFTRSGNSARLISKDRPRRPILAYTPSERVYRQLALWWGVWPRLIEMHGTTEELIATVERRLLSDHLLAEGEHVVIMGGLPVASRARTNFVKLHRIGEGRASD
uniref:Pyruvate kinase n=1 Tax=Thermogemmatispora argillosa TaxID=2045280 RepID=A0A455T5N4_9CHLR|nr:pyruvate kinase [Thermogemmatispora argillosa]